MRRKRKVSDRKPQRCPGPPSRREFLKVGVVTGLGLTLGDYFHLREAHAEASASPGAESVIYIFLAGGLSQLDSFDPKPMAPLEYRGELGSVKTKTGEVFSGSLPKLAGISDKFSVIRSMTHGEAAHERGTHNMLTGYRPSPAITYPSMGAIASHELGPRNNLPPYISIPHARNQYLGSGYLSAAYGPFSVGGEPGNKGFSVRDLNLPGAVDADRMERRRSLLAEVDSHFAGLERSDMLASMDSNYQRAYSLISSQHAREAFAIDKEPGEMRDRYGRHDFGQRLLLARRLVEAGARFITVVDGGWDHHQSIKDGYERKMPHVDQGTAALLADLQERGLLEKTLVVLATEFGRTVKINDDAGRDHWPKAFSIAMAGGGVKGGQVLGKTDQQGAEVLDNPVTPEDLAATLFTQLGIDPEKKLVTASNRPIDIVRHGQVIKNILA